MESFVDELPKAELHLHLVGEVASRPWPDPVSEDAAGDVSGDVSAETRA